MADVEVSNDAAMNNMTLEESPEQNSALEDNIQRKGKNAYYFAHAHKANGPKWDGKIEPKLLSKSASVGGQKLTKLSSFDMSKSNITKYAFLDEEKKVKLYIDMEGVGEKCTDEDISLDHTESSLCFIVENYKEEPQCLCFGKLAADISKASYKLKDDKIIITLTKVKEEEWHTINNKGSPDHEVV